MFKNTVLELQYRYSKLFVLGIPRRKFEYEISKGRFSASNTSRNTLVSIFTTAFASLGLVSGIIAFLGEPDIINAPMIIVFGLQAVIGIFALRQLLWLVNGAEQLIVENDTVFLRKKGTFWTRIYSCKLKDVDFITYPNRNNYSLSEKIQFNIRLNSLLIFRMTVGEISFSYRTKNIEIFSDMLESEKVLVVDNFKKLKQLSQPVQ